MAIDLPESPSEDDTYYSPSNQKTYTYKAGRWIASLVIPSTINFLNLPDVAPTTFAGQANYRVDVGPTASNLVFNRRNLSHSVMLEGIPITSNQVVLLADPEESFTVLSIANGGMTRAYAKTASNATVVYSLRKNDVEFGTFTFTSGVNRATVAIAADVGFTLGVDILSIIGPTVPNLVMSDIVFSVSGVI